MKPGDERLERPESQKNRKVRRTTRNRVECTKCRRRRTAPRHYIATDRDRINKCKNIGWGGGRRRGRYRRGKAEETTILPNIFRPEQEQLQKKWEKDRIGCCANVKEPPHRVTKKRQNVSKGEENKRGGGAIASAQKRSRGEETDGEQAGVILWRNPSGKPGERKKTRSAHCLKKSK